MTLPALRTYPRPYTERAHTFRAAVGNTPTAMTRSGSIRLIDHKKRCLPSGRLVPQHFLEHVPACVQDGFSHLSLNEFGTAHVTDDDKFVFTRNPGGCDMQMVSARVGNLGVDRTDALLVSGTLSVAQGVCMFPVMLESGHFGAVAANGDRLKAKVDAYLSNSALNLGNFTLENDVPAPTCVLREAASLDRTAKFTVFPKAIGRAHVCHKAIATADVSSTQG